MSQTRFYHFRNVRPDNTVDNHGGVTVAYRQEGTGVRVAKQGCYFKDNFCRKAGRIAAEAKLNTRNSVFVEGASVYDFHSYLSRVPNSSVVLVQFQNSVEALV
jgi:hypothetical protein